MIYRFFLFFSLFLFSPKAFSSDLDIINEIFKNFNVSIQNKLSIENFFIIFFLAFLPSFILIMTSFTRIIIVFGLLRNAMGTPYIPSNHVLVFLSFLLTSFIMEPTFKKIYHEAYFPFSQKKISIDCAFQKSLIPLKEFMLRQTYEKNLLVFSKLAHVSLQNKKKDVPIRILIPSFLISEIQTAFKIGFTIFLPFLIIDLLVSSVLMSLGMMMVPPSIISLPLKLIIFVVSDGWQLLITSLVHSFQV
jgi:flagellar biosynthetic protein FliP